MLKLLNWAVQKGIAINESEYLKKIHFARTNISNVRKGLQSFTKEHIHRACLVTGASADWIFGLSNVLKRKPVIKSLELLKQAVHAVELDMKNSR